jgi:uncharacterized membrane protein YfcA
MLWTDVFALTIAAAAGGAINAVAGGGTLVTFPTLLFLKTPSIVANATSTLGLVLGTSGSIFGFRRHLAKVRPWLLRFIPVSIIGGWLGARLLTMTSEKTFARLVPFLILFATLVFLFQGVARRLAGRGEIEKAPARLMIWGAIFFQFLVAVYGGYFGAGIGILMLATLGYIGLGDIHEMNALKTMLGSLINLVAAISFIWAGLIDWPKMWVMTAGSILGYYLGAYYSQRIPQQRVRQLITFIGFALSVITFYQQFLR